MQDLKTGHLHHASPKAQFYGQVSPFLLGPDEWYRRELAQIIGSFASVFVSSGIYILYRSVYELPSTNFPVPTAAIWLVLPCSLSKAY